MAWKQQMSGAAAHQGGRKSDFQITPEEDLRQAGYAFHKDFYTSVSAGRIFRLAIKAYKANSADGLPSVYIHLTTFKYNHYAGACIRRSVVSLALDEFIQLNSFLRDECSSTGGFDEVLDAILRAPTPIANSPSTSDHGARVLTMNQLMKKDYEESMALFPPSQPIPNFDCESEDEVSPRKIAKGVTFEKH